MKGGNVQTGTVHAFEQLGDARLHLARRLVGEGHSKDVARRQLGMVDQVRDLGGDHARLARAGTGQHQAGAVEVFDGLALSRIEVVHGLGFEQLALEAEQRGDVFVAVALFDQAVVVHQGHLHHRQLHAFFASHGLTDLQILAM